MRNPGSIFIYTIIVAIIETLLKRPPYTIKNDPLYGLEYHKHD